MVVGVFRPMILLPLSFGTGMTPEQVRMVLCHELAHIQRFDPVVNLFQRVMEAVLFYHPAVWFISRRIRFERELCCDDVVVRIHGAPRAYAESLVELAVEKGAGGIGAVALGATERHSDLGRRVMRLLSGKTNDYMGLPQTSLVAVALIAGLIFLGGTVYSQTAGQDEEPRDAASSEEESEQPADDGNEPASDRLEAAVEKIRRDIEALAKEFDDEALAIKLEQLNIVDRLREATDVAGERAVPVEVESKVFVKNLAAETQEIVEEITAEAREAIRDALMRSVEEAISNIPGGISLKRRENAADAEQSVTVPTEIDPLSQMLKAELEAVRLRSAELDSREADLQERLQKIDKAFEEKGREAQRRAEELTERAAELRRRGKEVTERAAEAKRIIAEGHILDVDSSSVAGPTFTLYNEHLSAEEDPLRQIVDLEFDEMPLKNIVQMLRDSGQIEVVVDVLTDGIVSANLNDIALGRGIEAILRMQGLGIVKEGEGFRITTWEDAAETRRETRMVTLKHADAGEIAVLLEDIVTESTGLGAIRIAANVTRNVVILSGPSELVKEFADLIQELDTTKPVIPTVTQPIPLDLSVNAEDMVQAAKKLLSDVGVVSYDLRSRQLIVTDIPVNIAEIRAMVDAETRRAVKEQRKSGGGVGLEIFDSSSLMTNDRMQDVQYQRALNGIVQRQLNDMDYVRSSKVFIREAPQEFFTRQQQRSEAAVTLDVTRSLSDGEIAAVLQIVQSIGGHNLSVNDITLVGDGKLLHKPRQPAVADLEVKLTEAQAIQEDELRRLARMEQQKSGAPSKPLAKPGNSSPSAQEPPSTLFNAHLSAEEDPLRQVVNLKFREMPLENIVQILKDLGEVKVVTDLPMDVRVSATIKQIPLGRGMEAILRMQGLGFVREDDGFRITTWDEAVNARRERIEGNAEELAIPPYKVAIQVKYAKEANLLPAVTLLLSESGTVKFDARSGHLLVTDTPAKVEEIRALVECLDVIVDIEQHEKTETLNRELKMLKAEEKAIREKLSVLERLEAEPRKGK